MGVGRFIKKSVNGLVLIINRWEFIVFVKNWVGVCRFCQKMGGSRFFLKKLVRVGRYC